MIGRRDINQRVTDVLGRYVGPGPAAALADEVGELVEEWVADAYAEGEQHGIDVMAPEQ